MPRQLMEPTVAEERRALIQRRVAGFAAVFAAFSTMGLVVRTIVFFTWGEDFFFVPRITLAYQGCAAGSLVALFLATRGRPRSLRFIRIAELLALLVTSTSFCMVAIVLSQKLTESPHVSALTGDEDVRLIVFMAFQVPNLAASFILTYALAIRAAFVPTPVRATAQLTTVVGLPLLVSGYYGGLGVAQFNIALLGPLTWALGSAVLWAVTVIVCTAISRVIYGLHSEVQEARRLGQYTIDRLIGEGGMGKVYRASHAMLRRPTAIKLLSPEGTNADALERFEREVQLTSELTHPNTVTIFDYGRTDEGVLYYAMELLDGATLEEVVDVDGAQPAARVLRILEQVAGALGEAHSIGLIHRDVKPANIVLSRQGGELDVAKVVDFGLVKQIDEAQGPAVSREGTISGTPLYMAPETLTASKGASPSSDLYALGAVGYFLLTGEHLFSGRTVVEVLGHHLHTEPEPPSERLGDPIPADLEALILDCLKKDPADRPKDAADFRHRLEACEGIARWSQRSARMWWQAHGPALEARATDPPRAESADKKKITMLVDLEQRSTG